MVIYCIQKNYFSIMFLIRVKAPLYRIIHAFFISTGNFKSSLLLLGDAYLQINFGWYFIRPLPLCLYAQNAYRCKYYMNTLTDGCKIHPKINLLKKCWSNLSQAGSVYKKACIGVPSLHYHMFLFNPLWWWLWPFRLKWELRCRFRRRLS